jgi:hypothetical protein
LAGEIEVIGRTIKVVIKVGMEVVDSTVGLSHESRADGEVLEVVDLGYLRVEED